MADMFTATNGSEGAGLSINGPASPTFLIYHMTVTAGAGGGTALGTRAANEWDYSWASTSLGEMGMGLIEGFVKPSANGTVTLRFRAETTNYEVTAKAGSFLTYRRLS
jgi:hypothetical protein